MPIRATSTPRGSTGARIQEAVTTTQRRGRFALTIARGESRNLLLTFPGVDDGLPAHRHLLLGVAASSSLKASRRALIGGGRVTFSGHVRAARTGLVVVLQGRENGSWHTFADAKTNQRGKRHASYRFSGRSGSYPIRLRIRRQAGLPYETGYSRTIVVRVH